MYVYVCLTEHTMADGQYLLHHYYNLVNTHPKPLKCQFCFKIFSAEELENHFFSEHRYHFPSRNSCPWCAGERSWKSRQKHRHARHLSSCFKRYKNRYEWNNNNSKPRDFYGRKMLSDAHLYAYESVFLPPLNGWWGEEEEEQQQQLFMESEDLAMRYIRKFIHFEGSPVGWFHLIVRAYALGTFFENFETYWDRAFLLEFSCWCDGGEPYEDLFRRHHRHFIALARNGKDFYENFWKKIQGMCYAIGSWRHLKNTIISLSSRKATCSLFDDWRRQKQSCHFYIFRPLAPHFKWRASLASGNIGEAITSLKGGEPVTPFAGKCCLGPRRMWRVKIGDLIDPWLITRLSRPLLESAKNDWWYPPKRQQVILDEVVPLMRQIIKK